MNRILLMLFLATAAGPVAQAQGFSFHSDPARKEVSVLYNGKLLTAYCFYDSVRKPILFPVKTLDGVTVTRGFPIAPRPGERTDHPHHTGIWFNYESVNGLDFWNNSTAIPSEKRNLYGTIVHQKVVTQKATKDRAELVIEARWNRPDHVALIDEQTTFIFSIRDSNFIIDRRTTVTALDTAVQFRDAKDGMMAMRVARELELPSKEQTSFVDDKGNVTKMESMNNNAVTGNYRSSEGKEGDSVWSTRARWVILTGRKDGKEITIGMVDHPSNPGYPTYWHARGYGLFALNPLGQKIFSKGAQEMNFTLQKHQAATFLYRILVHSGAPLTDQQMNEYSTDFANFK